VHKNASQAKSLQTQQGSVTLVLAGAKWLRNLVHPGAFVRELPADLDFNEQAFRNAYDILVAAFTAATHIIDESDER